MRHYRTKLEIIVGVMLLCMGYAVRDQMSEPQAKLELVYRSPELPASKVQADLLIAGNTVHGALLPEWNSSMKANVMRPEGRVGTIPANLDEVHWNIPIRSACGASILHKGLVYRVTEPNGQHRQFSDPKQAENYVENIWGCK